MTLNQKQGNQQLYEIEITLKGTKEKTYLHVYADHNLDASNYLIKNKIWGKQHSIRVHTSSLIK